MEHAEKQTPRQIWQWGVALVLPAATWGVAMAGNVPEKAALFYGITVFALALWALALIPDAITAFALPIAYIVTGVGKPAQMMSGWTSPIAWLLLGSLIIGSAMMRSGLARRIALGAMYMTGGSFYRLLWGILLAGLCLAPFSASPVGKAGILTVVCVGICEALGLERKSREAAAVMTAGFIGIAGARFTFLSAGSDNMLFVGLIKEASDIEISWMAFFKHNFVPSVIYCALSLATMIAVLRPNRHVRSKEYVRSEYAAQPPMSKAEMKISLVLFVMILLFVTESIHKMNAGWLLLLLACVTALPGMRLTDTESICKVSYTAMFFVVGCMSIGSAASTTGASQSLVDAVMPYLSGSEAYMMAASYVGGAVLNFLLTPLAALGALTAPLTQAAVKLGLNPVPIMYSFTYGVDQYIFPYEIAALLLFYSLGWTSLKQIVLVFGVRFFVGLFWLLGVAYPWWKWMGLFN